MKKFSACLLGLVALAVQAPAYATIIDTVDKNLKMSAGDWTITTHEVADLPYVSADLTVVLADDRHCDALFCADEWFGEKAFTVGLGHLGVIDGGSSHTFELGGLGLWELNLYDSYSYVLKAISGDFVFKQSILALETRAVPEPGSLMLLGLGLLGLAYVRRRRQSA